MIQSVVSQVSSPVEKNRPQSARIFIISMAIFCSIVLVELILIIQSNSGHFTYVLDDAYIHLALATHLHSGHYGINAEEMSAPSSSILWPFLLAPFSELPLADLLPLLLNFIFASLTVAVLSKIVVTKMSGHVSRLQVVIGVFFVVLFIAMTNLIGLIFTGMEHSLQVWLTVLIFIGLIFEIESGKSKWWLVGAIIIAPLVRYENLSLSMTALVFLGIFRHWRSVVIAFCLIVIPIFSFSMFLYSHGLGILPTSVLAKTGFSESHSWEHSLLFGFKTNLLCGRGALLFLISIGLILFASFSKADKKKRLFALIAVFASIAHLALGKFGWFGRYEIYVWIFDLLTVLYLSKLHLIRLLSVKQMFPLVVPFYIATVGLAAFAVKPYLKLLIEIPAGAVNIYQQQYQMSRFIKDFYHAPVAVNDIGLVSYQNPHYVLDLLGLASPAALHNRLTKHSSTWMDSLAAVHGAKLAMIYDEFFKTIPLSWVKIGELRLGSKQITCAGRYVSFYACNKTGIPAILTSIDQFKMTLPPQVMFVVGAGSGQNALKDFK